MALQEIPGFPGMTVSECRGFGKEEGKEVYHRVIEDLIDYIPKVRIEIMLYEDLLARYNRLQGLSRWKRDFKRIK